MFVTRVSKRARIFLPFRAPIMKNPIIRKIKYGEDNAPFILQIQSWRTRTLIREGLIKVVSPT